MTIKPKDLGRISEREFVVMISVIMALTALAIDLMLPAFPDMREAFGLAPDATDVAAIVKAVVRAANAWDLSNAEAAALFR